MTEETKMRSGVIRIGTVVLLATILGCSESLTTREKGAGVGAVVGSTVGAGIGSTFGYAVTGGMAGAGLGVGAGVLAGDYFQTLEKRQRDLEEKIEQCGLQIEQKCRELEQLKLEIEAE
ncbi:MAG TPA: hypothetical protein VLA17_08550 [Candidatus Limnocylindria bacterium]|nr:hypothetical protein [Candidatus Limnocylindria bacterium]